MVGDGRGHQPQRSETAVALVATARATRSACSAWSRASVGRHQVCAQGRQRFRDGARGDLDSRPSSLPLGCAELAHWGSLALSCWKVAGPSPAGRLDPIVCARRLDRAARLWSSTQLYGTHDGALSGKGGRLFSSSGCTTRGTTLETGEGADARRRRDQAPPINDRASAVPTTRSWRSPPTSSRPDCSIPPTLTGSKPAVRTNRSTSSPARSSSVA